MIITNQSLQVSRVIQADAATLFRAWTDPRELALWWRMSGNGWAFAGAAIDLRVGGRYRLSMTAPDGRTHTATGVYHEVQPPNRLAFTWDWEDPASRVGETLVTVEFKNAGDRRTEVVLTHERFADADRMARHEQGWTDLLSLLSRSHGDDRPSQISAARDIVDRYFESLKRKHAWDAFFADDVVFTSLTSPVKRVNGRAAFLESTKRFYSMISTVDVKEVLVDGDKVCALTQYELRSPAGTITSDVAEIFRIRDGKIASFDIYFDSAPFPK